MIASDRKMSGENLAQEATNQKPRSKIPSRIVLEAEAKKSMRDFDRNASKDLDREEFRRLLKNLDEFERDPLPANFE